MQGQVYGKRMAKAVLPPDAARLLYRFIDHGISVAIVSHKTEYGHRDVERIPLREVALTWLSDHGFFDSDGFALRETDVYFENTREEKVQRIADLKPEYFVDDLYEGFQEPEFPTGVGKLLYRAGDVCDEEISGVLQCENWEAVGQVIIGEETKADLVSMANRIMRDDSVVACTLAWEGINSKIYRVSRDKGSTAALKRYPVFSNDRRDRLGVEYKSFQFLRKNGLSTIPNPIREDKKTNVGVFEWVSGVPILSLIHI